MGFRLSGRAFETRLNVLLGRLLSSELGLIAISEYISRRDRPDIVVYVNGVKIILEGSYSRIDAESDVKRRIEDGLGDLGVALLYREDYPSSLTDSELEDRLRDSIFEVRLIVPEDISETLLAYLTRKKVESKWVTGWIEARVADLASILNEAIQFILTEADVIRAIDEIEQKINDFVESIKSVDKGKQTAKNLYDVFYKLYGLSVGNYEEIDELIYAKAALTIFLGATFYQSIRTQLGLNSISSLCRQHGYRLGLRKAFEEILKVDYERIYELAIQVIEVLPEEVNQALRRLVELAEGCASKRALLRKDFSGKIYHKIVGDWAVRKNFATYFTTIPAAYLLAYLTIFTRTGVFSEFNEDIKVGDIACGSGTLLTAAYSALRDLYIHSSFGKGDMDLKRFHKLMLEENIWGIDALRYAVQIASTNLALQDPTTPVTHMNTYAIPLGKEDKEVILGSLEFFKGKALPKISMYFEGARLKFMEEAEVASITGGEVPKEIPGFDLIIMNPPFTRATGRSGRERGGLFGFILDEQVRKGVISEYEELRRRVQKELENLTLRKREFADLPGFKELYKQYDTLSKLGIDELYNIGQAGEGLLFLYLASELIKEKGKLAFVLPKSLLTGTSWFLARNLLLNKFHLEHIVLSYDAENGYNFSESTSLSETLIVARKRWPPEENEETKITLLLRKPLTSLEAKALAFKIIKANGGEYLEVNGARAYVYKFSRREMITNIYNWGRLCAFPSPRLNEMVSRIFLGNFYEKTIPIAPLGEITDIVGLAVRRGTFHKVFKQVREGTPEAIPALISGEEEVRKRIATRSNSWVICRMPRYLSTASKFLVPDRIRVNTTHALALCCDKPVVCNVFFGLKPKRGIEMTEDAFKSLILWLNTTWGILSILANRTETEGGWIELTITKWKLQPVLDVTKLDEDCVRRLVAVFDKYCERDLQRLPKQFDPNKIDPVRRGIDREFLEALSVKFTDEDLSNLYRLVYRNLSTWIGES
jgi:hypothetical protein